MESKPGYDPEPYPIIGHELSLRGDQPDARTLPGAPYIRPLEVRQAEALEIAVRCLQYVPHDRMCRKRNCTTTRSDLCLFCECDCFKSRALADIRKAMEA